MAARIGAAIVGLQLGPLVQDWTARDAILYSLGIGARLPEDLEFVYEGRDGRGPTIEPTLALRAITPMLPPLVEALDIDLRSLLHASQAIDLHRLPNPAGSCTVTRTITGVWDKERAAIVDCVDDVVDSDGPLATARSSWWVRDAGGFGGIRSDPDAATPTALPDRAPDVQHTVHTTREQAALYRLSGDRNPVHIDPAFARESGQPRDVLHGLCTFGLLGHALDRFARTRQRLASIEGRFASPAFPGEDLVIDIWWCDDETALARVSSQHRPVLAPVRATFE